MNHLLLLNKLLQPGNRGSMLWAVIVIVLVSTDVMGQSSEIGKASPSGSKSYFAPEVLAGPHMHIYSRYPETDLTKTFFFSMGQYNSAASKPWAKFYWEPFTGISASITDFGNPDVFGYGISLLPYISFHTRRLDRPAWHVRFGMGAAYYTEYFDSENNPTNKSVGGPFSWSFQWSFYRDLVVREKMRIQIGAGWLHGSNGHTRLPNFGINTLSFGIQAQFYQQAVNWSAPDAASDSYQELDTAPSKRPSLLLRLGYGVHELGGPSGPVDGPSYPVYSAYLGISKTVKRFIRLRGGFGYRYYQAYYDYITENELEEFIDQPKWNASNIYVSVGAEFMMGHVTLDIELGTNLYKPFFGTFFDIFEEKSSFDKRLKSLILQRMGLYYYVWDTAKHPPFNLGLGCHINANNGQADFTGLSLVVVRRL